ncbi:MAG: DEAD/DEAH box helicase [Anaerovoracaceae bacterium]
MSKNNENNREVNEINKVKYSDSGVNPDIVKAVEDMGFTHMTPIQEQAIPVFMSGKDIIGQAQTGTGKTAAFGIPLIQKINGDDKNVQAIILCPTRELAVQVADEMRRFTKYMRSIKMVCIYGGQDMSRQIQAIKGSQIVIGTPGRVMDHMRRKTLKLNGIHTVVLDEADEMLNMGFREDIETILEDVPEERQIALFSATMPQAIIDITKKYQRNAIHVKTLKRELTMPSIDQYYFDVKSKDKEEVLCRLLDYHNPKRALIFCKTKRGADALSGILKARGYHAEPLHGDLSQGQRNAAMAQFRHGRANILIATDVAARGIDVDDVEAVFNYDIPMEEEYYVHRIGRTGRAGRKGQSFTFVVGKEIYKLKSIERYCKTEIKRGTLPSAVSVMKTKSDKIMHQAFRLSKQGELAHIKKLIRAKLNENGGSIEELAAGLLKMHMGEDVKEIDIFEFKENSQNHKKNKTGGKKPRPSRTRNNKNRNERKQKNYRHK